MAGVRGASVREHLQLRAVRRELHPGPGRRCLRDQARDQRLPVGFACSPAENELRTIRRYASVLSVAFERLRLQAIERHDRTGAFLLALGAGVAHEQRQPHEPSEEYQRTQ